MLEARDCSSSEKEGGQGKGDEPELHAAQAGAAVPVRDGGGGRVQGGLPDAQGAARPACACSGKAGARDPALRRPLTPAPVRAGC